MAQIHAMARNPARRAATAQTLDALAAALEELGLNAAAIPTPPPPGGLSFEQYLRTHAAPDALPEIPVHFRVIYRGDSRQYDENGDLVPSSNWTAAGDIRSAQLRHQVELLNQAFKDVFTFTFEPADFNQYYNNAGAITRQGYSATGQPMTCFPEPIPGDLSCSYQLPMDGGGIFYSTLYQPVVPHLLGDASFWGSGYWDGNNWIAAWQRALARALSRTGNKLRFGAADPTRLHIITLDMETFDGAVGGTVLMPWDYEYPFTYHTPQEPTDLEDLPVPLDENGKAFPPDGLLIDYRSIRDVPAILGRTEDTAVGYWGGTVVHEAGHWFGLLHTFDGTRAFEHPLHPGSARYVCSHNCPAVDGQRARMQDWWQVRVLNYTTKYLPNRPAATSATFDRAAARSAVAAVLADQTAELSAAGATPDQLTVARQRTLQDITSKVRYARKIFTAAQTWVSTYSQQLFLPAIQHTVPDPNQPCP